MNSNKTLIVIAGPTAVGKTDVAIQLAQHYNTQIISADSRQCYQEMSIGTAKPSPEELKLVHHYFIDAFSIHQSINAGDYETLALHYLEKIFAQNDIAILTGGTGLYIDALVNGIDEMPATDKAIEQQLQIEFENNGLAWLQQIVANEDPDFFAIAEQQNHARLIRALAFKRTNGQSIIDYRSGQKKERPFKIIKIALELPRPLLYERINLRVDQMVQNGLLEEVERLRPFSNIKNLHTVGYSEFYEYPTPLSETDKKAAIEKVKQHTRNYAKRQLTWFRKDKAYQWFEPGQYHDMLYFIIQKLKA